MSATEDSPAGPGEPRQSYQVATDGACKGNPGPTGWAWVGEDGEWAAGSLSQGTNKLIQKGAKLVMEVEDICEELPRELVLCAGGGGDGDAGSGAEAGVEADELESECLGLLVGSPRGPDWIAARVGIPPGELLACLSSMAIKGWVAEEAGGRFRLLINPSCRKKSI